MTTIKIGLYVLMIGCLLGLAGCGKKTDTGQENTAQLLTDAKNEANKMNVEQLKAKAIECKDAIVAKKAELEKAAAKLQAIPITQQMGDEAKGLQTDIANLSKAMLSLTERFQVYYSKLQQMGGDVSGLEI